MIVTEQQFRNDTKMWTPEDFQFINAIRKFIDKGFPVFISHKHGQIEYVSRLQSLLDKYGFSGYVDWEDDLMPKETSGETAMRLREKIRTCHKFILIATNEAIDSKWCNWEVGYADAKKYIDHIALLPLANDNLQFNGSEYLKIYPSIQVRNNMSGSEYYVAYPKGTEMSLKEWFEISINK